MTLLCKARCELYEPLSILRNKLSDGYARCRCCQVQVKWEGIWCPCCGSRLSRKGRANQYRNDHRRGKYPIRNLNITRLP